MTAEPVQATAAPRARPVLPDANTVIDLLLMRLSDGLDHPEMWPDMAPLHYAIVGLMDRIGERYHNRAGTQEHLLVLHALCVAADENLPAALAELEMAAVMRSQSALVHGARFFVHSLADPDNPKYRLKGKICTVPFEQLDVLDQSAHQCSARWLHQSAGNLARQPWRMVWNSHAAQAVRASVLDGSYRFCNKMTCPKIQTNGLEPSADLAARSPEWAAIQAEGRVKLDRGPKHVNLAYDRTCNLACPSCRTELFAADEGDRARFAQLQERAVLPLLQDAETVSITGSGDPFVSNDFRHLMTVLTPQAYPRLGFVIMTNGLLFTEQQWLAFPALHGRVRALRISTDGATRETHERLRSGSNWDRLLPNLAFAGRLVREGRIGEFQIIYTVQADNFREMGAAVDLARQWGATGIDFRRMTNWGTFDDAGYRDRAVFMPGHPEHAEFLEVMRDPRLRDPMVLLSDLEEFAPARAEGEERGRAFVY